MLAVCAPQAYVVNVQQALSSADIPRSVGRVLDLLEIVLAEGRCNLTAAAATAELTPTTALRHLRALETRGYLDRDEAGVFSAGPTVRRLAATVHDGGPIDRLVRAAQSHLDTLAEATGESVYLAVSDGEIATYLATAESPRALRHVAWVGQNVTLHGTAVGEALALPGTVAIRTGAVEPDITAISLALPIYEFTKAAISIVGPAQRLDRAARKHAVVELSRSVTALCTDLGLDRSQKDAS